MIRSDCVSVIGLLEDVYELLIKVVVIGGFMSYRVCDCGSVEIWVIGSDELMSK